MKSIGKPRQNLDIFDNLEINSWDAVQTPQFQKVYSHVCKLFKNSCNSSKENQILLVEIATEVDIYSDSVSNVRMSFQMLFWKNSCTQRSVARWSAYLMLRLFKKTTSLHFWPLLSKIYMLSLDFNCLWQSYWYFRSDRESKSERKMHSCK